MTSASGYIVRIVFFLPPHAQRARYIVAASALGGLSLCRPTTDHHDCWMLVPRSLLTPVRASHLLSSQLWDSVQRAGTVLTRLQFLTPKYPRDSKTFVHSLGIYMILYGGFLKWGYPQSSSIFIGFSRIFHETNINKPSSVLQGYPEVTPRHMLC